jgi:hypothetical protein
MQNFQQNLYKLLEAGLFVAVKSENNNFQIFSPTKDCNGNFRTSDWCKNLEEAKNYIGSWSGFPKEEIEKLSEENNWQIIDYWYLTPTLLKVGDKVKILETIKEINNWEYCQGDFSEMRGKIERVLYGREGLSYLINGWYIGAEFVVPLIEDEEDEIPEYTMEEEKAIKLLENNGFTITRNK